MQQENACVFFCVCLGVGGWGVEGPLLMIHIHYLTSKNLKVTKREETFTATTIYATR